MYPWNKIDPETDSTLRLILECVSREHTVAIATPHNLTMRDSVSSAFCQVFKKAPLDPITLNFLDSVRDDVFIMNDIDGLRIANTKLYAASFDDPKNHFIPVTHVSKYS